MTFVLPKDFILIQTIMIKKHSFFHNLEVEVTRGQYILIGRAHLTCWLKEVEVNPLSGVEIILP